MSNLKNKQGEEEVKEAEEEILCSQCKEPLDVNDKNMQKESLNPICYSCYCYKLNDYSPF